MKIDLHAHFIPRQCCDMVDDKGNKFGPTIRKDISGQEALFVGESSQGQIVSQITDPERRIQDMDAIGLDMQAISIIPTNMFYELSSEEGSNIVQKQNNAIAEIFTAHPDRFVGVGGVPLQNIGNAVQELERITALGFKAIQIGTSVNDKNLDDRDFWPFFAKAQDLDIPMFVHPWKIGGTSPLKGYHLSNLIGNPMSTTIAIARIIFGGVLRDFPRLKFVFAHAGGAAPFILGRWQHGYEFVAACQTIPKPPDEYFKQMFFDTVAHSQSALTYLVEQVGAEKIVLGSDYPFDMGDTDPVSIIRNTTRISKADRETILERSAEKLLRL